MRARRAEKRARAPTDRLDVPSLTRPEERQIKWIAFCVAVVIHALVLMISIPDTYRAPPRARTHAPLVVKRYVPPPPPLEQPRPRTVKRYTRKLPVPDPTPDLPEPIREHETEILFAAPLGEVDLLIGSPSPPDSKARSGRGEPLIAGVGSVTLPVRIEESYVIPEYPEIARLARIESRVILQAVIYADGTVGESAVLSCSRQGFGFEEAAVAAVMQWRYRPATQNGRPVDAYFSILVDFILT